MMRTEHVMCNVYAHACEYANLSDIDGDNKEDNDDN